jgi:hypothetical protein
MGDVTIILIKTEKRGLTLKKNLHCEILHNRTLRDKINHHILEKRIGNAIT